uniref:DUF1758 domain-containing protein n=1 Tax=Anopheles dirus TaxID=7168 RepID=A0A182NMZ3_9DIPT
MANTFSATSQVRLPKIDLPAFEYDSTQWISFKDRFSAMVHDVPGLSNTMKLQYLLASLKGEAARLFDHVELVEENYTSTWQALLERFDDLKLLKREYFRALVELQPMTRPTAEELTRIVIESKRLIRGMERLKEPVSSWNTPLSSLVRYTFDEETLMAHELIAAEQKEDVYTDLLEFCEKRIKILHSSVTQTRDKIYTKPAPEASSYRPERAEPKKLPVTYRRQFQPSLACASQSQRESTKECVVCHAPHSVANCSAFGKLTVADRQRIVREQALCFKSLGRHHQARFFKSREKCEICNKDHHTLVCNKMGEQVSANVQAAKQKMIWLSTAQVLVCNDEGRETPARALLDQGSQLNFISERLVQHVRLKKRRLHKPLCGIGAVVLKTEKVVEATIKSRISPFVSVVDCLVLSKITANFPAQTREIDNFNIPKEVVLADPSFYECEQIDLLLGAELFAEMLQQ